MCGPCKKSGDAEKPKGMIPDSDRKCRDLFCFFIFILFWIGMVVIAVIAGMNGDIWRLLYGTDYEGNTCGTGDLSGKKRIVYPRLTEDLLLNFADGKKKLNPLEYKFYGICVDTCPKAMDFVCNSAASEDTHLFVNSAPENHVNHTAALNCYESLNPADTRCNDVLTNCFVTPMNMSSVFYRCLPVFDTNKAAASVCKFPKRITDANDPACIVKQSDTSVTVREPAQENLLYDKINTVRGMWTRWVGDVQRAWWVIALCGVVLAVVFGFVWLILLKYCTGLMVFLTIVLVVVMMITLTFFCYFKAGILDPTAVVSLLDRAGSGTDVISQNLFESSSNKDKFKYAAWFFTACTILLLLVIIGIRKSIVAAVKIIKKASDGLGSHKMLIFYPFVTVIMLFGLMVYWVFIAGLMFSAGEKLDVTGFQDSVQKNIDLFNEEYPGSFSNATVARMQSQSFKAIEGLSSTRYLFAYHFFGLLWTVQVIQGIGMVTISGCIAAWYFNQNAEDRGKWPVTSAFWRALRYHFGSICFGGFLIALLQFIRVLVEYFRQKFADLEKKNAAFKLLMRIVQCCLWCLQKCVEIVTQNAFIYIAVKGESFVTSAKNAVLLIISNITDMAVVNTIGEILMLLGKVFVTCTCAFCAFLATDNLDQFKAGGESELTSSWLVVLVTMIFGFAVASAFFYIYDMAIDTILLCYCIDKSENKGKAVNMDPKSIFHGYKKAEAEAELADRTHMTDNPSRDLPASKVEEE